MTDPRRRGLNVKIALAAILALILSLVGFTVGRDLGIPGLVVAVPIGVAYGALASYVLVTSRRL